MDDFETLNIVDRKIIGKSSMFFLLLSLSLSISLSFPVFRLLWYLFPPTTPSQGVGKLLQR
jgi:hypothetical protein